MSINSLRRRCKELRRKKSKRTVEREKNTFEFIEKVFLFFFKKHRNCTQKCCVNRGFNPILAIHSNGCRSTV